MDKDIGVKIQDASAIQKADSLTANSANKLLYIVVTEDPTSKDEVKYFATSKVDKLTNFAEVIGYEVTSVQMKQIKTWNDVTELANKSKSMEIVNMTFPWHRVISIRNVSYKKAK